MIKIFRPFYGFFKMPQSMICKVDKHLCWTLNELFNYDITDVSNDGSYQVITLNIGYSIRFWNRNRYYGWMSAGELIDDNGKVFYKWHHSRPTRYLMAMCDKLVEDYLRKEAFFHHPDIEHLNKQSGKCDA